MKGLAKYRNNKMIMTAIQAAIITTVIMLSAVPLVAATSTGSTIWDTSTSAGSNFWNSIKNLYINALFLPLVGVSLIGWAFFAKNEKVRGGFATAIKGEVIVFIALQLPDVAIATFNQFAGWLNGATT